MEYDTGTSLGSSSWSLRIGNYHSSIVRITTSEFAKQGIEIL
jgi:hypothetical protein